MKHLESNTPPQALPAARPPAPNYQRIHELLALYRGSSVPRVRGNPPRVAVVGGGLGGLVATHLLAAAGCIPKLFDAAVRPGGRIRTDRELVPGLVSELGAEFIDTAHADIHALARYFGCSLIDTRARSESGLKRPYLFGNQSYQDSDVESAFRPFAKLIAADAARVSIHVCRRHHSVIDRHFDDISITQYLEGLGIDDWLRSMIGVAYTTVNGLDVSEQSSINLLKQIDTDGKGNLLLFGHSDERWKIVEGMDRIVDGLARSTSAFTSLNHRLVRIARRGASFELIFDSEGGRVSHGADVVVLAIPFTILRNVDCASVFSPPKKAAIDHLAYGTNSKVLVATQGRIWRDQGFDGGLYSDGDAQTGWDSSRLRGGVEGVYTIYVGGKVGIEVGRGDADTQATRLSHELDRVWPGFTESRTGGTKRVHWPSEPGVLASYSTYSVGQRTRLAGDEITPDGNIFFAGEHCSRFNQGYMQGAAETGRHAAMAILRRLAT